MQLIIYVFPYHCWPYYTDGMFYWATFNSLLDIDVVLQYFVKYKLAPGSAEQNSTEAKSDEVYRDYFLSSLCFVAQVPNVLLNGFNLFCRVKGW